MSYKNTVQYNTDKALLAFADGNQFGKSITLVGSQIPFNDNGNRVIPSGLFVAEKTDGTYRFLPRAKVTEAITTSQTEISVSPVEGLQVGDSLFVNDPYTVLTISAVTAAQTQVITVNGSSATATATTTVPADLALLVKQAIDNTYPLNSYIYSVVSGASVYLFPKDGKSLYTVTESGTATATLSAAALAFNTVAIGTITAVDAIAQKVTLSTVSSVALPVGVGIGAPVKSIVGMTCGSVDFTQQNRANLAILTKSGGVREHLLPYFEESFRSLFPQVLFSKNI